MSAKIVIGLGEILWDVFPDRKILGGAPANFAYHVSQFGLKGYAVSAIGDDALGKEVLASLADKELEHLVETIDYPTGTVQVTLDGRGVPSYVITENVAWDHIPFSDRTKQLALSASAACYGTLAQRSHDSQQTIRRFVAAMPKESMKILDVNLRGKYYSRELIEESIQISNVLKINDDELEIVAEMFSLMGDEKQMCISLLERFNLNILILTKGTSGSYVFTRNEVSFQPTPIVTVADTVGAGDSFTAAFTAAHLYGKSIAEAHRLAVEVSAFVCQNHGAMPRLSEKYRQLFR